MPYLSASAVVIHYEEMLYQVYAPLSLPLSLYDLASCSTLLINDFLKLIKKAENNIVIVARQMEYWRRRADTNGVTPLPLFRSLSGLRKDETKR